MSGSLLISILQRNRVQLSLYRVIGREEETKGKRKGRREGRAEREIKDGLCDCRGWKV